MQPQHIRRALEGRKSQAQTGGTLMNLVMLAVIMSLLTASHAMAVTLGGPSRSTSIALTSDNRRAVVVNRDANSVSIIRVRSARGRDVFKKLAEVEVGLEPRYVAVSPDDREAYVTNTVSGTVSVINLQTYAVVAEIPVGTEPRGCVVAPNGTLLYVANHTEGSVSVIDVATRTVSYTITTGVGVNPTALAITNDGDTDDNDETVFVSDFFAKLIPGGPGEGFDTGRQGVVYAFPVSVSPPASTTRINLAPLQDSGFTADRSKFCPQSFVPPPPPLSQTLHSDIFCPDLNAPAGSPTITAAPQAVFPSQLQSLLIRNVFLYVPSIGAQPEPPVRFNVNVQGLINVVNTNTLVDIPERKVNLNAQVTIERNAGNTVGIRGLHATDIVAIDATFDAESPVFFIVNRGGDYVIRAQPGLINGQLNIGAPNNVIRFRTGHIPNGIVVSTDGARAYTNNEVGHSITAINLRRNRVMVRDIPSSEPPAPGTFAHAVLLGKLVFHTGLGIPDNGIFSMPIRRVNTLANVGKASDSAWSSCTSCHPDGLTDGVTWFFPDGPRQTLPLDGSHSKKFSIDQRIFNWSAARSSTTDFNNNSRAVQGGCGFASDAFAATACPAAGGAAQAANPGIYDHGLAQGASDALDAMSLWVETVRAPILPQAGNAGDRVAGQAIFEALCTSCHGGAKWTKSQVIYADNPAFFANPAIGGVPRDPGVTNTGTQIRSYTVDPPGGTGPFDVDFLEDVDTFDPNDPLEIRGAGAAIGTTALGSLGFNVPSLLGLRYHAPYFHNGSARNLNQVLARHQLGGATIASQLSAAERGDLIAFLSSIDGATDTVSPSDIDQFLDDISAVAP